ncbi:MAG TPA: hypothetical protein VEU96_19245 [Bryobacteraceae bacterium]|nr:hypothetical protein [Bryobacteraceae bacterium]
MPISIALLLGLTMMQSVPTPPPILFIAREPLVAGRENAYRKIEEETARLSATLGCPHPYLAMESLTGPKEIWWFNGFDSPEDQNQVAEAYQNNAPFSAALKKNRDHKAPATGKVIEIVAQYRPGLSSGAPWILGHARFLAIAVSKDRPSSAGTVFQAADGTFFVFSPARTRKQADRLAASIPGSTVVVARPSFSFPAKDWVDADPRFWRAKSQ